MKRYCLWTCFSLLLGAIWLISAPQISFGDADESGKKGAVLDLSSGKVFDLTHLLKPGLPDFHQGGQSFSYKQVFSVEKDGYGNGSFSMVEHYGTHVDAPNHFYLGKLSVDQIAPQDLIVPCVVIDVRSEVKNNPDYQLSAERLIRFEQDGIVPPHAAVLLLTGWDARWRVSSDYRNADDNGVMHFPGFSAEACDILVNQRHVAALGIDTLSIDAGSNALFSCHKIALATGIYMIENLKDLALLPARGALLFCGPLRIENGTGSPARVLAVTP